MYKVSLFVDVDVVVVCCCGEEKVPCVSAVGVRAGDSSEGERQNVKSMVLPKGDAASHGDVGMKRRQRRHCSDTAV